MRVLPTAAPAAPVWDRDVGVGSLVIAWRLRLFVLRGCVPDRLGPRGPLLLIGALLLARIGTPLLGSMTGGVPVLLLRSVLPARVGRSHWLRSGGPAVVAAPDLSVAPGVGCGLFAGVGVLRKETIVGIPRIVIDAHAANPAPRRKCCSLVASVSSTPEGIQAS